MSQRERRDGVKLDGLIIGSLAGFGDRGEPLVEFAGNLSAEPVAARATCALAPEDLGRELGLLFEGGDPALPVVVGVILDSVRPLTTVRGADVGTALEVQVDGERLALVAKREIVIRTGHASITLSADGKVTINGKDLLSRSTGPNRIRGGSIQLN